MEIDHPPVRLREFRRSDLQAVYNIMADPKVTTTLSFSPKKAWQVQVMLDEIAQRASLNPRREYYLAVTVPPGDEMVGMARLGISQGGKRAELGFAIAHRHWRQGYALGAASALVELGFTKLQLSELYLRTAEDNVAAQVLAAKLGFTPQGVLRRQVCKDGTWHDRVLYVKPAQSPQPSRKGRRVVSR